MYKLTQSLAQKIVEKMMKDIPYNINIMDKRGVIIGSGNKNRIGTIHKGAIEAIKQRKIVEIQTDKKFEKKGINLPIEMNEEIVGVVGISGDVTEIRPFGNIVKSTVILLIEQNVALSKENREKNDKQAFFNLLIDPDTEYTKDIINQALTYNINLNKPSQLIYAELPDEFNEDMKSLSYYPSFKVSNRSLCIIVQNSNNMEAILNQIKDIYLDAYISLSKINNTVSEGFRQAKATIRVMKNVLPNKKTFSYANCEFIADVSDLIINEKRTADLLPLLEKNDDLIKTLQTYINCNLNVSETANQLIIHRNTLNYRLNRIHKMTGKDPNNILELIELLFMLINRT